jgi:hypothetical protein
MIIFAYRQTSMLWVVNKQRKQWQKTDKDHNNRKLQKQYAT